MKYKKWGASNKETLEMFLVNFKEDLANKIKSEVLLDKNIMSLSRHKFYYYLRGTKCKLPAVGSTTKKYWIARGWNSDEAEVKRIKIKIGNKSPMRIKYWLNKGYNKEDAIFKIKSMRKLNKEYWLNKGYSEVKAINSVKDFQSQQGIKSKEKLNIIRITNPEKFDNKIEYWLNKGYSETEAKEKLKYRQTTFSLEKCIKKHGKNKGTKIFNKRQEKWKNSLHKNFQKYGDSRTPSSKFASECIYEICNRLNINIPVKEKWIKGDKNNFSYDFCYNNKIIEFNGDYWHCNPNKFTAEYYNKSIKMTALEKWNYDNEKIKLAEDKGYKVIVIWESEYFKNKNQIIEKCIEFLNN